MVHTWIPLYNIGTNLSHTLLGVKMQFNLDVCINIFLYDGIIKSRIIINKSYLFYPKVKFIQGNILKFVTIHKILETIS